MTDRRLVALAFVVACLAVLACCQQALSIDGPVRVEDRVSACGISLPSGNCATCVASQCCGQATACAADPPCLALETCLQGCVGDYACRATCIEVDPVGSGVDVPALDTCIARSCNDACGLLCGVPGSYTTPDVAQDCQECIEFNACPETQACTTDLACETAAQCAYACTTPDCRAACSGDAGASAVVSTFLDAALAVGPDCYLRCKWGQNWTCIGKAGPPRARSPGVAQDVTLTIEDNGPGVSGASAQACGADDPTCASPLSTGTSDAQGMATLSGLPPAGLYGFQGFFRLASPGMVGSTFWLSFPLSEPHAQLTVPLLQSAELDRYVTDVGLAADATRGTIWIFAQDCMQLPAPAVTVEVVGLDDPATRIVYFDGQQPSKTATSTSAPVTVMIFGIAPGQWTLRVRPVSTGQVSGQATLYVAAGELSVVSVMPASKVSRRGQGTQQTVCSFASDPPDGVEVPVTVQDTLVGAFATYLYEL
ncbi:MAG: hypothetical protein ACRELB_25455 [Polyangiaceae bacterium]